MRVVVASESSAIRDQVRQAALSLGVECAAADCLRHQDVPKKIAGPAVLVLHVGLDVAAALAVVHRMADHAPPPILVVCDEGLEKELPGLIRGGAHAYLRPAHLTADLQLALQELHESGSLSVNEGRTIAVAGAAPGVGVTTVATNLAFALADKSERRVVLVQLDANRDLALNLQLQPAYALATLADAWYRLDGQLLGRRMIEHPGGVTVLADVPSGPAADWTPAAVRQVLVLLRSRFDFVVVDGGHAADPAIHQALRFASDVIMVTRLDLPAVHQTRHAVERLRFAGVKSERLVSVANRFGQHQQMDWRLARNAIGVPMVEWIPDDPAVANHGLNAGRPMVQVAPAALISQSFKRLARHWLNSAHQIGQPELQQVG
jgi:pilus assembly protein CpaE